MRDDISKLEAEIALHLRTLSSGASQADYDHARQRIAEVRRQIEHHERNVVFVRDTFVDD